MRLRHAAVMRTRHSSRRRMLFGAAALMVLSGCTGGLPTNPSTVGSIVDVTVKDFEITAPVGVVAADGTVTFRIYNKGPATHEFVVARTDLPSGELPLGVDGTSADEEQFDVPGEVSEIPTWTTEALTLRLAPGRYVFFCNLEGHYLGGMHASFRVSDGGAHD
jgi:uncharacterized cupredoxin-like copper-binding protein